MSAGTGRSVLVTGAGAGIGRAVAARFVELGDSVLVTDVDGDAAAAVALDLGDRATPLAVDVRAHTQLEDAVALAVSRHGGLDVLVNNAGVASTSSLADLDHEEFDRLVAINLRGTFNGLKAAVPALVARGGGCIVNVASTAGLNGAPLLGGYGATKAAVINLTKTAAVELRPHRIRVNCVCPAFVRTSLTAALDAGFERAGGATAQEAFGTRAGRAGRPEEVALAVAHLCDPGSSWVTGTAYVLDGGLTASQF